MAYDPLQYDRQGNPVAGGGNINSMKVKCQTCGRVWSYTQTVLDSAQGKPRTYKLPTTHVLQDDFNDIAAIVKAHLTPVYPAPLPKND